MHLTRARVWYVCDCGLNISKEVDGGAGRATATARMFECSHCHKAIVLEVSVGQQPAGTVTREIAIDVYEKNTAYDSTILLRERQDGVMLAKRKVRQAGIEHIVTVVRDFICGREAASQGERRWDCERGQRTGRD